MGLPAPSERGLPLAAPLAALPPEWPVDLLPGIQSLRQAAGEALVVLDDDPTGTQTVYGVPVLSEWSPAALRAELTTTGAANTFFILTNSRSLPLPQACALNAEIGRNLVEAGRHARRALTLISPSLTPPP